MGFLNAFSVIGRVFLAAAFVCIGFGAVLEGEGRVALFIVALTIGIIGVVFAFIGSRLGRVSGLDKILRATGVDGTAEVTSLGETGVTVNGSPVIEFGLRVDSPVHAPYDITIRQRAPRLMIGAVLPGSTVSVRVDPADREHLAIDFQRPPPSISPSPAPEPIVEIPADEPPPVRDAERLLRVGRAATAVVISMEDAGDMSELGLVEVGTSGDDDRLFVIDMEVQQPGSAPYEVRVAHRVPERLVGRIGPRTSLKVAVDRSDDHAVAIDWDSVRR